MTNLTTYNVTTITRKGALPRTATVLATTKAKAAVFAEQAHRKAEGLAPSVTVTATAINEVV